MFYKSLIFILVCMAIGFTQVTITSPQKNYTYYYKSDVDSVLNVKWQSTSPVDTFRANVTYDSIVTEIPRVVKKISVNTVSLPNTVTSYNFGNINQIVKSMNQPINPIAHPMGTAIYIYCAGYTRIYADGFWQLKFVGGERCTIFTDTGYRPIPQYNGPDSVFCGITYECPINSSQLVVFAYKNSPTHPYQIGDSVYISLVQGSLQFPIYKSAINLNSKTGMINWKVQMGPGMVYSTVNGTITPTHIDITNPFTFKIVTVRKTGEIVQGTSDHIFAITPSTHTINPIVIVKLIPTYSENKMYNVLGQRISSMPNGIALKNKRLISFIK
jgi:hypothetical protein